MFKADRGRGGSKRKWERIENPHNVKRVRTASPWRRESVGVANADGTGRADAWLKYHGRLLREQGQCAGLGEQAAMGGKNGWELKTSFSETWVLNMHTYFPTPVHVRIYMGESNEKRPRKNVSEILETDAFVG